MVFTEWINAGKNVLYAMPPKKSRVLGGKKRRDWFLREQKNTNVTCDGLNYDNWTKGRVKIV
jgi:hypothetical protein